MKNETISFQQGRNCRKNITLIYIHGGGLVFGHKEDFPSIYKNLFLNQGYDFLSLNYPLAPESSLPEILEDLTQTIESFFQNPKDYGISSDDYIILGRSSGAFLGFRLIAQYLKNPPKAFISMYGYDSLEYDTLQKKNPHYLTYPPGDPDLVTELDPTQKIYESSNEDRFLIYLYLRQQGLWGSSIEGSSKYPPLSKEVLEDFPYTILVSSVYDPDVDYAISKSLSKKIKKSKMITVYEEGHDFDRDTDNNRGFQVYQEIIEWLEDLLKEEYQ